MLDRNGCVVDAFQCTYGTTLHFQLPRSYARELAARPVATPAAETPAPAPSPAPRKRFLRGRLARQTPRAIDIEVATSQEPELNPPSRVVVSFADGFVEATVDRSLTVREGSVGRDQTTRLSLALDREQRDKPLAVQWPGATIGLE